MYTAKTKPKTINFKPEDIEIIRKKSLELVPKLGSKLSDRKLVMYAIANL